LKIQRNSLDVYQYFKLDGISLITLTKKLNLFLLWLYTNMQIKKYFKQPYPYYYGNRKRFILFLLLICFLSFAFSYFFEPFEVNRAEHKIHTIWIMLLHSFIPFPIILGYFSFLNLTVKEETQWTLGKELFHISMVLLLIGITDFLIRDLIYTNPNNWSLQYFWEEIRNTFLVGFLLLLILLPINLERLIKKHTTSSKKITIEPLVTTEKNEAIVIQTPIATEVFNLEIAKFLFAEVEGNYTEIHTKTPESSVKILVRMTLKELEEQLTSFPFIFRTHRSYLVNLYQVTSISGNAQGYLIHLKDYTNPLPVSRSKIEEFNKTYQQL
tara:strand:+ start:147123 stop:148100 length:978 start_codon:yes stop_codon:yes gene_type:complete